MDTWGYHVEAGPTDWGVIQQMPTQAGSEGWGLVAFGLSDGRNSYTNTQMLGGQCFAVLKRPGNC